MPEAAVRPVRSSRQETAAAAEERVTYDQMMERLRRNADSRKGARRSEQPVLRTRKVRRNLLIGLGSAALLALGLWQGFRFLNTVRMRGDTFRAELSRRVSELIGAKAELGRCDRGAGSDIAASKGRIQFAPDDFLQAAEFADLSARLDNASWYTPDWHASMLTLGRADLNFTPGAYTSDGTGDQRLNITASVAGERRKGEKFRFGIASNPDSISIDTLRLGNLSLRWKGASGEEESLSELQGLAAVKVAGAGFELHDGLLQLSGLSPRKVKTLNGRIEGSNLVIESSRIEVTADADLVLSGTAELKRSGGLSLKAKLEPLMIIHILPEYWRTRLLGRLEVPSATWQSGFSDGPPPALTGNFLLKDAALVKLPFLEKIAKLASLRSHQLVPLDLESLTGTFRLSHQGIELTGIQGARKDGAVKLSGDFRLDATGNPAGSITVQFPAGSLTTTPPGFVQLPNGGHAISLTLSGDPAMLGDSLGSSAETFVPDGKSNPLQPSAPAVPPAEKDKVLEDSFRELIGK